MSRFNNIGLSTAFIFAFIFATVTQTLAQSPYEVSVKRDLPVLTLGLAASAGSVFFDFNITPLVEEQVIDRIGNPNDINRFDRRAVNYYSRNARTASDVLLITSQTAPFLFLLNKRTRSEFIPIGVMTAEVVLVNGALTAFTKGFVHRTRPFVYNPNVDVEEKLTTNARLSFYSGHTSATSALSFFSAKLFNDYYPDSKWKPVVWTAAALVPAATGYFRVKGGKHFPTDVITGYITGGLIGYFIPALHLKKDKNQKVGINIYPGPNSLGLVMTW